MTQDPPAPASGIVPVFPLPHAVLFPDTVLPLHVFEPRYRRMVEDAMQGEQHIAIALLRPGYEKDYEGSPAIHTIGTVGKIERLERLPDGRFQLDLVGVGRARLSEIPSDRPYRMATVDTLPEIAVDENDPEVLRAKLELLASQGLLLQEISGEGDAQRILDDRLSFSAAVNGACANLPVDTAIRQELLEVDDPLARHRRALDRMNEVLTKILEIKAGQAGLDDPSLLN